jgi:hypothetical protein
MRENEKGRPTGSTGSGTGEEAPVGKKGQHWRGEPWEKNPKVGGKESAGETGEGTSGQHWRGEDMPPEKGKHAGTETAGQTGGSSAQTSTSQSDRPDEC